MLNGMEEMGMKKRLIISISIVLILVAAMVTSSVLMSIKPDTTHINNSQKIAEYTKPAVVRILNYVNVKWTYVSTKNSSYDEVLYNFFENIKNTDEFGGWGSGAIISSNGYIVTNAHVVELSKLDNQELANMSLENLSGIFVQFYKEYYNSEISYDDAYNFMLGYARWTNIDRFIDVFLPGGQIAATQIPDSKTVFDAEIKSYGAPVGNGKDVAVLKIEAENLPTLSIGDSEKVQLQDSVLAFGFPAAAYSSLLSPESSLVVSITDGKISAIDKKSAQGAPVLQMSAPITHGSSGGPVVQEDGSMIGITTFRGDKVNGQEVQGFNFVVPSNTVKEFVAQSGSKNELGDVDILYREGLEFYWGGYYNDALLKFESIQRLFPEQSEIKNLISDCQKKSLSSKILWSKYKAAFLTFDALAFISIILILLATFRGRNKRPVLYAIKDSAPEKDEPPRLFIHETTNQDASGDILIEKNTEKNIENQIDYEMLRKYGVNIEDLKDFNNDGKIDMEDVLIELQHKNQEKNMVKDIQDQVNHDSKKQE
jgi:serine protease Do